MHASPKRFLPGDLPLRHDKAVALRVNHAGEYGATRIYAGQRAVLKEAGLQETLAHMAAQEEAHLATFNTLLPELRVRPTALLPLWHVGGWLMGAVTAMMGTKAAMACTVAVEEVITEHYTQQLEGDAIGDALKPTIARFRDEEMEHHDIGLAHDAQNAPLYGALSAAIRGICRGAIWLSARI